MLYSFLRSSCHYIYGATVHSYFFSNLERVHAKAVKWAFLSSVWLHYWRGAEMEFPDFCLVDFWMYGTILNYIINNLVREYLQGVTTFPVSLFLWILVGLEKPFKIGFALTEKIYCTVQSPKVHKWKTAYTDGKGNHLSNFLLKCKVKQHPELIISLRHNVQNN